MFLYFFSLFFSPFLHNIATSLNKLSRKLCLFCRTAFNLPDTRDEKRVSVRKYISSCRFDDGQENTRQFAKRGMKVEWERENEKKRVGGRDRRWIVFRLKIPWLGTIRNPRFLFSFFLFFLLNDTAASISRVN